MSEIAIPTVSVNNDSVGLVPESLVFDEGLGEQRILAVSEGGGEVSQVFANNLESNFGMVRFSIRSTPQNIELARSWKAGGNTNVVIISGEDASGNDFIRTYTQAAIVNSYEVPMSVEGAIDIEFQANAPT